MGSTNGNVAIGTPDGNLLDGSNNTLAEMGLRSILTDATEG